MSKPDMSAVLVYADLTNVKPGARLVGLALALKEIELQQAHISSSGYRQVKAILEAAMEAARDEVRESQVWFAAENGLDPATQTIMVCATPVFVWAETEGDGKS